MAISEIQTPNLDRFISAAGYQDTAIVTDVDAHYGQLVPVQGQEEPQGVVVVDANGGIQQPSSDD